VILFSGKLIQVQGKY